MSKGATTHMKFSVSLETDVIMLARLVAEERGESISAFINDAVKKYLRSKLTSEKFELFMQQRIEELRAEWGDEE